MNPFSENLVQPVPWRFVRTRRTRSCLSCVRQGQRKEVGEGSVLGACTRGLSAPA